jgi:GT2 family glycosyltransferase
LKPTVRIIILHRGDGRLTRQALLACLQLTYPAWDCLLVDNEPTRSSNLGELTNLDARIQLLTSPWNLGFAGGMNFACQHSWENENIQFFLLLNNDTLVQPDTLDQLVTAAEAAPRVGVVGGKVFQAAAGGLLYGAWGVVNFRQFLGRIEGAGQADMASYQQLRPVDFVLGCGLLLSRQLLETIGLFDPTFFAYHEEVDLCWRATQAGFGVIFAPQAIFRHIGSAALPGLTGQAIRHYFLGRNSILFLKKHGKWHHWLKFGLFLSLDALYRAPLLFFPAARRCLFLRYQGYLDGATGRDLPRLVRDFLDIPADWQARLPAAAHFSARPG